MRADRMLLRIDAGCLLVKLAGAAFAQQPLPGMGPPPDWGKDPADAAAAATPAPAHALQCRSRAALQPLPRPHAESGGRPIGTCVGAFLASYPAGPESPTRAMMGGFSTSARQDRNQRDH